MLEIGVVALDVHNTAGTVADSFCHLNGLKMDGNGNLGDTTFAVKNVDSTASKHHIRITNSVFAHNLGTKTLIDRRGGTGQTVLEFDGAKHARTSNAPGSQKGLVVTMHGASGMNRSFLFARDCDTPSAEALFLVPDPMVGPPPSTDYKFSGRNNWTMTGGWVPDDDGGEA